MDPTERRARTGVDATEWWLQLKGENMPREAREQFVCWLRESPLHVEEMLRIAQVHDALDRFKHWDRISTEGASEERIENVLDFPMGPSLDASSVSNRGAAAPARSEGGRRQRTGVFWRAALAASVLVLAMATTLWITARWNHAVVTERGERREVTLNDGSVLEMDPETRLQVTLEKHKRDIVLERGRALFRVAPDPRRPFTVRAAGTVVRAVGTAFAVEQKGDSVLVTVAQGKVAVSSQGGAKSRVYLVANQQVAVRQKRPMARVRQVDSRRELSWTQGRLVFTDDTIAQAVEDFNRYNRLQIHVADPALASRPVSGVFDASDPESFIAFIQTVAPVSVDRGDGHDITIASAQ